MGDCQSLADDIVTNVGGKENVVDLVHCITRLRFTLKDESLANTDALKNMDGVVTVVKSSGQYQVVIGNKVDEVYEGVMNTLGLQSNAAKDEDAKPKKWGSRVIEVVSGIFQPILGIMAACGMLKGLNSLFVILGLYSSTSGGYLIINAAGDALFTFLPLFLGYTAAKTFGSKPMLGLAMGAAMCYPASQLSFISQNAEPLYTVLENTIFASPVYMEFFGIPIISMNYTGSVVPVILAVWFASKCERLFNKIIPDLVKFFVVPMLTLLIALPVALMFLGPLATLASSLISDFTLMVRGVSPILAGAIVGGTWQILVIFGIHWGFIPVYINNIMTLGYDNVMMPFFACTFATSAVVLGIFVKTKDRKLKQMAIPNFISGIFGVTEPALYGMLVPLKTPLVISCISGAIGGAFYGQFNFRKFMMGGMGIFELPNMMNPDGTMGNIIVALVGIAISMVAGFVLTMIFYKDPARKVVGESEPTAVEALGENVLTSPLTGTVVALSDVKDKAFSSGALGDGVAIIPQEGVLYAPTDGTVEVVFPTGHAIGMRTSEGAELLMHIGMDTVQMDGKGFIPAVKAGDQVKRGQKLLEFDVAEIQKAGHDIVSPIVVTNSQALGGLTKTASGSVRSGDVLLTIA